GRARVGRVAAHSGQTGAAAVDRAGQERARPPRALRGAAPGAAGGLADAVRMLEQMGFAHPGALPILPDAIEALAGTGDTELAEAFRERLERQYAALDSAWAQAALARSHGTLLVARGDPEAAVALLEEGVSTFD